MNTNRTSGDLTRATAPGSQGRRPPRHYFFFFLPFFLSFFFFAMSSPPSDSAADAPGAASEAAHADAGCSGTCCCDEMVISSPRRGEARSPGDCHARLTPSLTVHLRVVPNEQAIGGDRDA